jgi:hypothetical protein
MEQREGSMCKFGCIRAFLELEIKNQGPKWKNMVNLGLRVDIVNLKGLFIKWHRI